MGYKGVILSLIFFASQGLFGLDIQCPVGSVLKEVKEKSGAKQMTCGRDKGPGFEKHGPEVETFKNGNRKQQSYYIKGKLEGSILKWNKKGQLLFKAEYKAGKEISKKIFK